jgi:MFS family permease
MLSSKLKLPSFSILGTIIWLIAALFFLYEFFLRTFIGTLAHQILPDLHLNAETFALISVGYYITYGVMQIPVGICADRFGIKKVLTFAILVCALSAILFAYAHNFSSAFLCRLLMGFGSSFAFVCLLTIALTWFPHQYFGFLAGASQFIGTMGSLLAGGPFIFFIMRLHGNWRLAIFEIGLLGIVLALLAVLIVKNKSRPVGDQSLIVLTRPHSLLDTLRRLMTNRQAWYVAVYSACIYLPIALLGALWGVNYLEARGLPQAIAADMISIGWLGYALGCPILGGFSDLIRRRKFALILSAIVGLIVTLCISYIPLHSAWIYGFLFFMLGLAAAGQNVGFAVISEHVSLQARATALGLNNGVVILFAAIFPLITSYFIHRSMIGVEHPLHPGNFLLGFMVMPLLCLVAIIISIFLIKETYCRPQKTTVVLDASNKNASH